MKRFCCLCHCTECRMSWIKAWSWTVKFSVSDPSECADEGEEEESDRPEAPWTCGSSCNPCITLSIRVWNIWFCRAAFWQNCSILAINSAFWGFAVCSRATNSALKAPTLLRASALKEFTSCPNLELISCQKSDSAESSSLLLISFRCLISLTALVWKSLMIISNTELLRSRVWLIQWTASWYTDRLVSGSACALSRPCR